MENIKVFAKDFAPFCFVGEYLGHKRPDGVETKNWHYYRGDTGEIYHFRKENIICVITSDL